MQVDAQERQGRCHPPPISDRQCKEREQQGEAYVVPEYVVVVAVPEEGIAVAARGEFHRQTDSVQVGRHTGDGHDGAVAIREAGGARYDPAGHQM
jgi:hypothetical protein